MTDDKNKYKLLRTILWVITIIFAAILISNAIKGRQKVDVSSIDSDWSKLMVILKTMDENYVDDIDHKKVTEDILPALMKELDPHSVYLPPSDLKEAEESLQGGFDGIGIQFNVPSDTAVVTSVIVGGPSEKAGLMTGDRIIKVDDTVIAGVQMDQDSMVKLMRGPKGTKVKISVKRSGEADLIPFDITRDKIPVNSIDVAFMWNDTTGYIKLSKFARTSYLEFLEAAADLRKQGMKRLIFDLRDNTGGYLDQALLLSNEFLKKGDLIVYMEGKHRKREDMYADGHGSCQSIDLAVLINESSASSSEIFAGAMQDNDRATIYGVRSFGKGLVQEPVYFTDGSGIRLTIQRFYTPSGRCIQKPYADDYDYDIIHRYSNGELFNADSIKVDDSLKFTTKGGRTVYGGGGIIPDVFVPLDTVGSNEFYVKCNRLGLQNKYASKFFDSNAAGLRAQTTLESLNSFLDSKGIESGFLSFAAANGATPKNDEWERARDLVLTQVRALIARYSPLGDNGFYPIYLTTDRLVSIAAGEQQP
ncbi:MAG: S41 family peptidase [Bacteroidales bacterium]|jgi:carboxyl-terminal processing protease|nr:S41 family peptidase [Bacteroidales bacterium]